MAGVTVRYWAAAREAAGRAEEQLEGTTLAMVLAAARAAHGPRLAEVLARSSFLVDAAPVGGREPASVVLAAGSVIEVLPPFAGG
jgi:sulfur-carrier protein